MSEKKNILYIHGYKGSPTGHSYNLIKEYLPDCYNLIGVDYDVDEESEYAAQYAREDIQKAIDKYKPIALIGSSLGGFLTLTMFGIPRVVINPCMIPSVELPKLGASKNYANSFARYEHWFDNLSEDEKCDITGLFAWTDELLGDKYVKMFEKQCGYVARLNGGHHVSKEMARIIPSMIAIMTTK